MASSKVALNNKVWRCLGRRFKIKLISSMKPISNMRSASSNTRVLMWLKSTAPLLRWSSNRPGVATNTCTPFCRASTCALMLTPPYTSAHFTWLCWAYFSKLLKTCKANSRVGVNTKAWITGLSCWLMVGIKRCKMGSANAAVLPVPVCAPAMMSCPNSTGGMAANWMGVGWV